MRVLVPEASRPGEQLALPSDEAAHVSRVLRLTTGDTLRVFNGRGGEWTGTIQSGTRTSVTVRLDEAVVARRETRVRYTVALAVLKGDGTDDAIRDAVMMGASRVRPFVSTRAETSVQAVLRGHRLERWQRVAIAAAKQCGRALLPEIDAPVAFDRLATTSDGALRLLLVEPSAAMDAVAIVDLPAPVAVTIAVGPEGGWTAEEVALASRQGWMRVGLGGRTLRATSAPLAALAACQAVWRDD